MVDLKDAKMEDFRVVRVYQRDQNPDEKVRYTFYRLKFGTYTPKQHNYRHSPMPCGQGQFMGIGGDRVPSSYMPPITYIHASEAARTMAGGRGVDGSKPTEQREQSQVYLNSAESRRRKTALELCSLATEGTQEGQIPPPIS